MIQIMRNRTKPRFGRQALLYTYPRAYMHTHACMYTHTHTPVSWRSAEYSVRDNVREDHFLTWFHTASANITF